MDQHGEHLPDNPLLVDQVSRRPIVRFGLLVADVRDDLKRAIVLEVPENPLVRCNITIFLRNRHHCRVALFELIIHALQLDQLLHAKRSPKRPIGRNDNVLLAFEVLQRDSLTVRTGQPKLLRLVTNLQRLGLAPIRLRGISHGSRRTR